MDGVTRLRRTERDRSRELAEVEAIAWLLDNSIPVPGTGRRFGVDAIIGLVPVVGDVVSAGMGLFVVWRASRMGLPRIVVTRMLVVSALDFVIGSIPIAGDAFDLWFKANTRNLALLRRHLQRPETSTRDDWMVVTGLLGVIIAIVAIIGWLLVSLVSAVIGLFG
ncbi:MAG TPA: DUF4112 domain-containing protein [Candidatus Limnocylindria bacterium]|nr:DUF4112 domain-containing protein [Candidatus Limnocylindria bacterium]